MRENAHRPTTGSALARTLLSNRVGVEGEKLRSLSWSRNARICAALVSLEFECNFVGTDFFFKCNALKKHGFKITCNKFKIEWAWLKIDIFTLKINAISLS